MWGFWSKDEEVVEKDAPSAKSSEIIEKDDTSPKASEIIEKDDTSPKTSEIVEKDALSPKSSEIIKQLVMTKDVLSSLSKHISLNDLKTVRLVCKEWYNASLSTIRSSAILKFTHGKLCVPRQAGAKDSYYNIRKIFLKEFLEFWGSDCASEPFRQFYLQSWSSSMDALEVNQFWQSVGANMTTLTLSRYKFNGVDEVRKVLYQACPKLQTLKIDTCTVQNSNYAMDDKYYEYKSNEVESYKDPTFGKHIHLKSLSIEHCLPDSWLEMLSHFQSIATLSVLRSHIPTYYNDLRRRFEIYGEKTPRDTLHLLKAIKIIRARDPQNLPLENFNGSDLFHLDSGKESLETFELLRELKLPVRRLLIGLQTGVEENDIKNVLEFHSDTITYFECEKSRAAPPCSEFPFGIPFTSLKELCIVNRFCDNLKFLKYTQNLEGLGIYSGRKYSRKPFQARYLFSNTSPLEMAEVSLPKLKELSLDLTLSVDDLKSLSKWIPNATNIDMFLNNELFAIVCENWKNLKILKDLGDQLSDAGVTGKYEGLFGEERIRPNITALTMLTRFSTKSKRLTGKSVFNGFLKLPCLQKVELGAEIDAEAEAALYEDGITGYRHQRYENQSASVWSIMVSKVNSIIWSLSESPLSLMGVSGFYPSAQQSSETIEGNEKKNENIVENNELAISPPIVSEELLKNMQLILSKVSEYLSRGDLAKVRLVCKEWYHASLSSWRSSTTLWLRHGKIHVIKRDGERSIHEYELCKTTLQEFLKFWNRECSSEPFRKFHLWDWSSNMEVLEVTQFWKSVGESMTSLTLCQCKFPTVEDVRKVIYEACPKLQSLTIDTCRVLTYPIDGSYFEYTNQNESYMEPIFGEQIHLKSLTIKHCLPDSWLQLLSHFPLLTSLSVQNAVSEYETKRFGDFYYCTEKPRETLELLRAIEKIRAPDKKNLPLENFEVSNLILFQRGQESQDTFQLFHGLHLSLQFLSIICPHSDMDRDALKNVLKFHSGTLTLIECKTSNNGTQCSEFPFGVEFRSLKKLSTSSDFCGNLQFLKFTPNLEGLTISYPGGCNDNENNPVHPLEASHLFDNTCQLEMADLILSKLKMLRLDLSMSEENFRMLVKWMPNMIHIETFFTDKLFVIACKSWTNLEVVRDNGDQLTDEGVTGMHGKHVGEGNVQPNITDLKCLVWFTSQSTRLTAKSVFDGFLKLPCLESLSLRAKIDAKALTAMQEEGVYIDCYDI